MQTLLVIADLLLALGATLRLTRFVVADDVPGQWWIKDPLNRAAAISARQGVRPPWARYIAGLSCPYCVSVWMSAAVVVSLALAGGPGDASDWWRYLAGFLTLAWFTAHIAVIVGDVEDEE